MTVYIGPKPFKDRGYTYQRPTPKEAQEMGWRHVDIGYRDLGKYDEMVKWCQDIIWWQDYITSYGSFYFKYEKDALMFILKFS